jgi:hypothetical protein
MESIMKMLALISPAVILALGGAAPTLSFAAPNDQAPPIEVVTRGADGHATAVRIDGKEYTVCSQQIQDSCINPYQAGLSWGHKPLNDWPGQPASELHGEGLGG